MSAFLRMVCTVPRKSSYHIQSVFQCLKPNDFEQVKAGVAYAASPADYIGRQSRPFRRSLGFSLGGLLKGRTILQLFQTQVKSLNDFVVNTIDKEHCEIL